jgi:hypothetical protein
MSDRNPPRAKIPGVRMPHLRKFLPVGIYFLSERVAAFQQRGDRVPDGLEVVWLAPPEEYSSVVCPWTPRNPFYDFDYRLHHLTLGDPWTPPPDGERDGEHFERRHGHLLSIQDICASYYYGGNQEANAGFVCRRETNEMIQDAATAQ